MIAQKLEENSLPEYRISALLWGKVFWSIIFRKHRSILADSLAAFADGSPGIKFLGLEHIPPAEPCVVVCNHFSRPGFKAWWIALGISAAFSGKRTPGKCEDVHWVMTSAWTYPANSWQSRLVTPMTRWLFSRIASVYGFISMPPMPPTEHESQQRAASVLKTLRLAAKKRSEGVLIGLAPEGRDIEGKFGTFPDGVGDFIALLAQTGLKILPVGVYEDQGYLVVSFGETFLPEIPTDKTERDLRIASQVIAAIKRQIPDDDFK